MKKILIATNVLTLIFLYFQSCVTMPKVTDGNGSFQINKDPIYSSCYNCITDDIHGETAAEFVDVTARYRYTHQRVYNAYVRNQLSNPGMLSPYSIAGEKFNDARSCWYSVDTLKKFICLLEKYSGKVKLNTSQLGIRFYYANYPQGYLRDVPSEIHHTLFLTSTFKDKNGVNIDFDPRVSASTGAITSLGNLINRQDSNYLRRPLFMIAGTTDPTHYRVSMSTTGTSTSNISMNQGDLCPPSTDCNETVNAVDATEPDPHP